MNELAVTALLIPQNPTVNERHFQHFGSAVPFPNTTGVARACPETAGPTSPRRESGPRKVPGATSRWRGIDNTAGWP